MAAFAGLILWFVRLCIMTFWLVDILDMPFMEEFDTTHPLNGLFWFLFYVLYMANMYIPGTIKVEKANDDR